VNYLPSAQRFLPIGDLTSSLEGSWHWWWTSLVGRIIALALFTAILPTFLRLHCRPPASSTAHPGPTTIDLTAPAGNPSLAPAGNPTLAPTGNPSPAPAGNPSPAPAANQPSTALDPNTPPANADSAQGVNPWNPIAWTRQEWFWAVDFSLGAWVAYFGSIAETYKRNQDIPSSVLVIGIILTILTAATTSFVERNGWDVVPGHPPKLRRIRGIVAPNMLGVLCIILAMVHVTKLHH